MKNLSLRLVFVFFSPIFLAAGNDPVITAALGTGLGIEHFNPTDEEIALSADNLKKAGFSTSWDASPQVFTHGSGGLLTNEKYFTHYRKLSKVLRSRNIGIAIGFKRPQLLPGSSADFPGLYGEKLNPSTGLFEKTSWNFGSADALRKFSDAAKLFFQKLGPFEMFYSDEVILGEPGKEAHKSKMSGYWTSPTYSQEALTSFREYLVQKKFPNAAKARFPVTTKEVSAGTDANMGLPAVPLSPKNSDRLTADNQWPDSELWKHWYAWRSDINTAWLSALTSLAYEANKNNPHWMGCYYEAPVFWMVPELGQDIEAIARLPHIDFLVAGYTQGEKYPLVKKIAEANGKKWGLQVEVSRYGRETGMPVDYITNTFRNAVTDGASLITCYAAQTFRTDRTNVSENHRKNGWYYMPEQAGAWSSCTEWLKTGRGLKTFSFE